MRLARVAPLPLPLSPAPRPFTLLSQFSAPRTFPCSRGCCAAVATRPSLSRPLFPSSRAYTPPGRQQPFGAAPLDPQPFRDRFVSLARVAFPSPFRVGVWWSFLTCPALFPLALPPGTRAFSRPVRLRRCPFFCHPCPLLCFVCSVPFPRCLLALCCSLSACACG